MTKAGKSAADKTTRSTGQVGDLGSSDMDPHDGPSWPDRFLILAAVVSLRETKKIKKHTWSNQGAGHSSDIVALREVLVVFVLCIQYIYLSLSRLVESKRCRKFAHCVFLSKL